MCTNNDYLCLCYLLTCQEDVRTHHHDDGGRMVTPPSVGLEHWTGSNVTIYFILILNLSSED